MVEYFQSKRKVYDNLSVTAIIIPTAPEFIKLNINDNTFDFFIDGIILTKIATNKKEGKNIPKLAITAPLSPCNW